MSEYSEFYQCMYYVNALHLLAAPHHSHSTIVCCTKEITAVILHFVGTGAAAGL